MNDNLFFAQTQLRYVLDYMRTHKLHENVDDDNRALYYILMNVLNYIDSALSNTLEENS